LISIDWAKVYSNFAIAFGWGPDRVSKLTIPQVLCYLDELSTEPRGTNDNDKLAQALRTAQKRTGRDKFKLDELRV